jgi:hypothetical protein
MNLIVFETDDLERNYVNSHDIPDNINTGSIQRGAGSVNCTLKNNASYELVVFVKYNYFLHHFVEYSNSLNKFIKDLKHYNMINESTKLI